jgi:hypothetical protein
MLTDNKLEREKCVARSAAAERVCLTCCWNYELNAVIPHEEICREGEEVENGGRQQM